MVELGGQDNKNTSKVTRRVSLVHEVSKKCNHKHPYRTKLKIIILPVETTWRVNAAPSLIFIKLRNCRQIVQTDPALSRLSQIIRVGFGVDGLIRTMVSAE